MTAGELSSSTVPLTVGSETKYIEVVINNIGGIKERVFRWGLQP